MKPLNGGRPILLLLLLLLLPPGTAGLLLLLLLLLLLPPGIAGLLLLLPATAGNLDDVISWAVHRDLMSLLPSTTGQVLPNIPKVGLFWAPLSL